MYASGKPSKRRAIVWTIAGVILGCALGAVANFFVLQLLLRSAEWHAVLFMEVALGVLLITLAIRKARRFGVGFTPGALLGVTLAIAASWLLLFLVVGL
ncbi:MAG: hypothetical protein WA814_12900 [Candidatus Baltobacteraceae bacterium]